MNNCNPCGGFGCLDCENDNGHISISKDMLVNFDNISIVDSHVWKQPKSITIEIPLNLAPVLKLLLMEHKHACLKHPSFPQNKFEQLAILQEEVGEYSHELQNDALNMEIGNNTVTELAQIGSAVLRMLENYKHG